MLHLFMFISLFSKSEQLIRIAQHDLHIKMYPEIKLYIYFLIFFDILIDRYKITDLDGLESHENNKDRKSVV